MKTSSVVHGSQVDALGARNAEHSSRTLTSAFAPALIMLLSALAITAAWRLATDAGWWLPLLAGSGIAALVVWRRIRWPDGWSRYLSFGALLLLACVANRVLYLVDFAMGGSGYLDWPFYFAEPEAAIIKAEVMTMAGTFLTVLVWWVAGGARPSPGLLLNTAGASLVRLLVVTYATSLLAMVALAFVPALAIMSGQLLPTMLVLGSATAFFLPILLARNKAIRLLLVVLMGLPFVYVALGTGMKENIILALVPAGYLLWNYSPRRGARVAFVFLAVLGVALISSYIGYFRGEVWHADRAIDQTQVMDEYVASVTDEGLAGTVSEGVEAFLSRSNAAPYRGWAVAIADTEGYEPGLVFSPLLHVFVPRILWPEKPLIRQGWEYAGLVFGDNYIAWSESSLSAGLYPALYLGGGWFGVVLGALCVGLSMAICTRLAFTLGGPALVGLFTLSMLPYALRLDEAWTVGALSAPLINFVYIGAIFFAARVVSGFIGPSEGHDI